MKQISADKKKEIDRQLALLKERDDKEYQRRVKALKEAKKSRQKFIDKERKRIMQDVKKEEVKTQNNGLKVAVIALSVLLLFFVVSTVVFSNSANAYMNMAENAYNKAYYQLVMDMNNMETSLAKAIASNSNIAKGRSLNELSSLAMSAENNLATLPNKSEEEQNTVSKFFNQVMDYSNFLADKLYKGGTLTEEEEKNLQTLLSINTALKQSINDTFENGLENPQIIFSTGILSNKEMLNPLDDTYKEVSESSIEYPTLIYDGPFSDEKADAKEQLKEGEGISKEQAKEKASKVLEGYGELEENEISNGDYNLYTYSASINDAQKTVGIDKKSGMVLYMTSYREVEGEKLSVKECKEKAISYLEDLGFNNLSVVWQNKKDGILTLNIAYEDDGAVYYSRLIKVSVSMDNGEVLGLESATYVANYGKEHSVNTSLSIEQARALVNKKLDVKTQRLTVIPMNSKEITAYEFHGELNDMTFYVYIDANSGEEINVLRVIENDQQGQIVL